ncbi:MAG TPA: PBP1A family penicillin-binding protein, partial [Chthoniobacteraceae bacterium]|nr:PBP1A family penicillin-binding protein [Chthoniobacteraceae bacterium]
RFDLHALAVVPQRSAVYDTNGERYSYLHGENRLVVPLSRVSPRFIAALLAREDARFREHHGVDVKGIVRAAWTNFRRGGVRQGASTLTQQLARGAFGLSGRSVHRKALEAMLARRIEDNFTKDQILALYVNRIYFGAGFYGIETAARGYFSKHASELTLGESALLAGLIRSPNKFSPIRNLAAAIAERDDVLDRMVELGLISSAESAAARACPPLLAQDPSLRFEDDYVMDAVRREVEKLLPAEQIELGGLRIFTTIDPQLQDAAQRAADRQLRTIEARKDYPHPRRSEFAESAANETEMGTNYLQAAVVAVDNRTGAIRAIVGGRDYRESKYSRAILARRQIGSTFKPFVYGTAFQRGLLPGTLIDDSKLQAGEFTNIANTWSPANSDGEYSGLQPAAWGLLKSRNTMSVRVGEFAGLSSVRNVAAALGIGDSMPAFPVAFLGAFETTLRDLTAAYTIFPNLGVKRPTYLVARIEAPDGRVIYTAPQKDRQILSQEAAWMVSWILQNVMKTGTAAKAESLGWRKPAGGKTGTTNDFYDAWFVGYTSSLTCGVWVGMDEPQTIMEKAYGSALALPIWVDFMNQASNNLYPAQPLQPPVPLYSVRLCSASGERATSLCEQLHLGYATRLPPSRVPGASCSHHPEPQRQLLYAADVRLPSTSAFPPAGGVSAPESTSGEVMPPPATSSQAQGSDRLVSVAPPVVPRTTYELEAARISPPIETPPQAVRVLRAIPVERDR